MPAAGGYVAVQHALSETAGQMWELRRRKQIREPAFATGRPSARIDLVDHAGAIPDLARLTRALSGISPVLAVPGNHDERVGVRLVRDAVLGAGGRWLPEEPMRSPIHVDGVINPGGARPRVLCAHDPSVFPKAVAAGYDLVLAGNLHGGQCVLLNRRGRQYPAAWFNRWHGLRFENEKSLMLVSRGAANTFPFRINCPREGVLCVLA